MDKLILLSIAISPIIDIIYTVTYKFLNINIPIQQILRALIVILLVVSIKNKRHRIVLLGISTTLIMGQVYMVIWGYQYSLIGNMSFILKIINLVATIFYFIEKIDRKEIDISKIMTCLNIAAIILATNIIVSNIFKIGLKTYDYGDRRGYKGFIDAHNDVTVVLLILFPIIIYQCTTYRKKLHIGLAIMVAVSLFLVGTKAGKILLLIEGILVFLVIINLKIMKNIKKYKKFMGIVGIFICLFSYTNLNTINNELDMFAKNKGYRSIYSYIVSYRDIQTILIDNEIGNEYRIHPKYIFGMGYDYANNVLHSQKNEFNSIENDIDGLIYYTGIITATLILGILLNLYFIILKNIKKSTKLSKFIVIAISIAWIHAFLGGHVLYSALANTYFAVCIAIGYSLIGCKEEVKSTNENEIRKSSHYIG